MWKLKACPRCGGDMFVSADMETWFEQCLQCGCRRELRDIRRVSWTQSAGEKAAPAPAED
ncbi:MAG: hypothetical protein PHN78_00345 [Dehalococcoidales bacterium]|nr:hypothetical protein [Dehalococcoidales bacterium]